MSVHINPDAIENPWGLSGMQCKVIGFVVEGLTAKEIGTEMCISYKTVQTHMERVLEKMGTKRSVLAAVAWDRFTRGQSATPAATMEERA
jgi:DNA-binding NarL/FixJ family response regulator